MAVRRPNPVAGETVVPELAGACCRRHGESLGGRRGVEVGDLQARYRRRTIAVLGDCETAGGDHRRLMTPGNVGTTLTIGSDREVGRIVIAAQRDGAGSITDLQRARIGYADIRGTDADE